MATGIKEITVKNADGDADTTATILIQNKIDYTPKVSVIIPVYNVEQYLRECLDSVINQTLKDIEIICVDDGSTDASLKILTEYANRDNRITVLTQENHGAGIARNCGINVATGDFIAFMDPDDFYPSNETLKHMYESAVKNDVNICGGSLNQLKDGKIVANPQNFEKGYTFEKNELIEYKNYQFDYGYWRFIYNRKFLNENKLLFPDYLRGQDPVFFTEAMCKAEKFYALTEATYVYRVSHKGVPWNTRKLVDAYKSIMHCLQISKKYKMNVLHVRSASHMNYKVFEQPLLDNVYNEKVVRQVIKTINEVDDDIFPHKQLNILYETITKSWLLKDEKPKVSVLMPAYNSEEFIAEAIESILSQTYPYFEFIIINDGSTDNTVKVIQDYAEKDSRIRFIDNKKNRGLIAVLNQGLKLCKGEYIARMDSDDVSYPDRFEKQIDYMEKHKDVGILSCWFEYFPEKKDSTIGHHKEFIRFDDILKGWCINHGMSVFRKSVFIKHNLKYNPNFKAAEDYELWSQAIKYTKIRNLQEVLYKYRKHGNSVCDTQRVIQNENSNKVKRNMLEYLLTKTDNKNFRNYIKRLLLNKVYVLNKIPVVLAIDDRYAKPLAVCLRSILEKTSAFIDFIILSDGISKENVKRIKLSIKDFSNFKISFIDLKKFDLDKFPIVDRFPVNVFSRYFIPEICQDYDKVVYTDADVVFNGDIAEYFKIDLEGKGIAATADEFGAERGGKFNQKERKKLFGIEDSHLYFANGNLIISCDYWRKNNITEKLVIKTNELKDKLVCPDLDVMNVVFQNNYKRLHFRYCTETHRYGAIKGNQEMIDAYKDPFIIHYSAGLKPWNTEKVLFFDEWNEIYKKTVFYHSNKSIKPYVFFPYYLVANFAMKFVIIPLLKFYKHIKHIVYAHSYRGKMDMLNQNFRAILADIQSIKNDIKQMSDKN